MLRWGFQLQTIGQRLQTPKLTTGSVTPAQSFLGVGGSGVWLPQGHDLFNFPEFVRWNLFSLLFSQTGLGLSNYRYNIGGGSVNVSNPCVPPETFYVASGRLKLERRPAIHLLSAAGPRPWRPDGMIYYDPNYATNKDVHSQVPGIAGSNDDEEGIEEEDSSVRAAP
ncbi:hypothetical protein B0H14DRAFT_2557061 [Mycena olivaceomarginata]|nr:hypothetical protein B0H14DRAFT_2557061 [Mycena olivaceomarginata]